MELPLHPVLGPAWKFPTFRPFSLKEVTILWGCSHVFPSLSRKKRNASPTLNEKLSPQAGHAIDSFTRWRFSLGNPFFPATRRWDIARSTTFFPLFQNPPLLLLLDQSTDLPSRPPSPPPGILFQIRGAPFKIKPPSNRTASFAPPQEK